MREDKTFKVRLNHAILSSENNCDLNVNANNDKTRFWTAIDYSEEEPQVSTFCVRFQRSEFASEFETMFNEAKKSNTEKEKQIFVDIENDDQNYEKEDQVKKDDGEKKEDKNESEKSEKSKNFTEKVEKEPKKEQNLKENEGITEKKEKE